MMFEKNYTNQQIAKGIIACDDKIYLYLVECFLKKVITHVCRNSGSREDGEELFDDVVLSIFEKIQDGKFDVNGGAFGGYFMTIVRNKWLDHLRKQHRVIHTEDLDVTSQTISGYDEGELVAEEIYLIQLRAISKHLQHLKKDEQEFMRMYYYAKQSLKTIAEYLGITDGNARVKHLRIKEKLRKMIANDPEFSILLT